MLRQLSHVWHGGEPARHNRPMTRFTPQPSQPGSRWRVALALTGLLSMAGALHSGVDEATILVQLIAERLRALAKCRKLREQ